MFLTRTGIKKLMQRSYKGGGLSVRNDGRGLSISGTEWAAYFLKGEMPKETLGDLIAMVGELPGPCEAYTATKAGNQMEIYSDTLLSAMDAALASDGDRYLERTPLMIRSFPYFYLVMQACDQSITLVDANKAAIVQPSLVDADDGEELPDGPVRSIETVEGKIPGCVAWGNNRMAFCIAYIYLTNDHEKNMVGMLENYKLWEDTDAEG